MFLATISLRAHMRRTCVRAPQRARTCVHHSVRARACTVACALPCADPTRLLVLACTCSVGRRAHMLARTCCAAYPDRGQASSVFWPTRSNRASSAMARLARAVQRIAMMAGHSGSICIQSLSTSTTPATWLRRSRVPLAQVARWAAPQSLALLCAARLLCCLDTRCVSLDARV